MYLKMNVTSVCNRDKQNWHLCPLYTKLLEIITVTTKNIEIMSVKDCTKRIVEKHTVCHGTTDNMNKKVKQSGCEIMRQIAD